MYKVLLDENLPVKIKFRLQDVCDIFTVKDMDWNALENGDLIMQCKKMVSCMLYCIKYSG